MEKRNGTVTNTLLYLFLKIIVNSLQFLLICLSFQFIY